MCRKSLLDEKLTSTYAKTAICLAIAECAGVSTKGNARTYLYMCLRRAYTIQVTEGEPMQTLLQDLRYSLRMLFKNPGFTLIALFTLAFGIGANTAIFSVVNTVMLRPLPFRNADQLVRLYESNPERGLPTLGVSQRNFLDWRARNQTFVGMAATTTASFNLNAGGDIEVIRGTLITADFLPVLGVSPALGRNFLPEEDRPGGNTRVALISHEFWQREYGGEPGIVGRTLMINDNPFTVVGVLPESFVWSPGPNKLFVPLAPDPAGNVDDHRLLVIGHLKPGVNLEQALTDMNIIAQQLANQYPETNKGWRVGGRRIYDWFISEGNRRSLLVLISAVIFLLLIACSNVANLFLARVTDRQKELSIRMALGAGRFRIIRQLLFEALLLALIAGGLGLLIALWAVKGLQTMNPIGWPRLDELSVDGRAPAFSLLISFVSAALFGLFPALQASRPDLNETLKEGGRSSGGAKGRQRMRGALVIVEVALSVTLLIGAGLLLRSFSKLQDVKLGFEPDHLLTMRINLPRGRYRENMESWNFYARLLQECKALPGVRNAALTSHVPMSGGYTSSEAQIPGRGVAPDDSMASTIWRNISPGYLRTLGIPLRGRDFDERDTAESQPVTIISEEMARRYWPGEDPLGKTVILRSFGKKPFTIIGVAGDIRAFRFDWEPEPMAYVPTTAMATWNPMSLVVRTRAEPMAQTPAVRGVLRSIDANVPVYEIRTVGQLLYDSLGSRRFNIFLLGSFAGVSLILASVGLFGVVAYLVSQRTHEIGVRLALGARPYDIFKLVIGRGMLLALVGLGVGLAAAFGLARFLESLLFQVKPTNAFVFTVAPTLLLGVAVLACYTPARRAMNVDPMIALRYEG